MLNFGFKFYISNLFYDRCIANEPQLQDIHKLECCPNAQDVKPNYYRADRHYGMIVWNKFA